MRPRRTRTIRLALMGSIGLVGTLAGCDEAPEADAFRTVQECIAKTGQEVSCREAEQAAQALAADSAPAFRSQAACEAAFGNCAPARQVPTREQADAAASQFGDAPAASPGTAPSQTAASGGGAGSWFMPAAAGFLLGRVLGGGGPAPFFQSRQYGAVGFAPGGTRLPLDPNSFANQRDRQQQASSNSRSGYSGGNRSDYSTSTRSASSTSVTSSPSRTGGFGSTARSSSSSSGG